MHLTFKNLVLIFDTVFSNNNSYFFVFRIYETHLIMGGDKKYVSMQTHLLQERS